MGTILTTIHLIYFIQIDHLQFFYFVEIATKIEFFLIQLIVIVQRIDTKYNQKKQYLLNLQSDSSNLIHQKQYYSNQRITIAELEHQNYSERDLLIKKPRQDIIQLPYIRHPKQLRVNSITNLKNISSDRFRQYIQQIQLKRLVKRDQVSVNNSETEIYPSLNLQAKQMKFSEKELKTNNLSVLISQSNILNPGQNLQANKISFTRLNLQQNSYPQVITINKDSSRRFRTINQIESTEIMEQQENKQQLYLRLRLRNSLIKQTINNWIKQRYNAKKKINP